jgi:hypothetical protein
MGGILQVDTIQNNNATTLITQTNTTTLTFGVSGQNIVIPSGVTFNTASATINYPAGSIVNADISNSTINLTTKVTGTLPVANGGTGLAALGTSLQVLRTNTSATALEFATVSGSVFGTALFHVRDEKANGTNSGAPSASYTARILNTVLTNEISGASLASDQITLPAGTFYISALAPFRSVNIGKLKLRNTSDSSDTIIGTNGFSGNATNATCHTFLHGRFTIGSSKVFELQFQATNLSLTGLGTAASFGDVEVYTDVQIWKVA